MTPIIICGKYICRYKQQAMPISETIPRLFRSEGAPLTPQLLEKQQKAVQLMKFSEDANSIKQGMNELVEVEKEMSKVLGPFNIDLYQVRCKLLSAFLLAGSFFI